MYLNKSHKLIISLSKKPPKFECLMVGLTRATARTIFMTVLYNPVLTFPKNMKEK